MLFLITLLLFIVFALIVYIIDDSWTISPFLEAFFKGCFTTISFIFITMIISIIFTYITIPAQVARFEQRYESLQYQLTNNVYDNDNDIGKTDLYKEVEKWNRDLAYRKEAQDDFWVGIFYANIYDQFEFIKYPEVN